MSKANFEDIIKILNRNGFSFQTEVLGDEDILYYCFKHEDLDEVFFHYSKKGKCWVITSAFFQLGSCDLDNPKKLHEFIKKLKAYAS